MVGWVAWARKIRGGASLGTPAYALLWGQKGRSKKKVHMWGSGEGAKGTCWAPAPGVGGCRELRDSLFPGFLCTSKP